MSRPVTSRWRDAFSVSDLSPTARAVCCALATFMDSRTGECWPSVETLATVLRRNRRTVQRALREIEDAGWVNVKRGGGKGKATTYTAARVPPYVPDVPVKGRQSEHETAAGRAVKGGAGAARSYEVTEGGRGRLSGAAPSVKTSACCGSAVADDHGDEICSTCGSLAAVAA